MVVGQSPTERDDVNRPSSGTHASCQQQQNQHNAPLPSAKRPIPQPLLYGEIMLHRTFFSILCVRWAFSPTFFLLSCGAFLIFQSQVHADASSSPSASSTEKAFAPVAWQEVSAEKWDFLVAQAQNSAPQKNRLAAFSSIARILRSISVAPVTEESGKIRRHELFLEMFHWQGSREVFIEGDLPTGLFDIAQGFALLWQSAENDADPVIQAHALFLLGFLPSSSTAKIIVTQEKNDAIHDFARQQATLAARKLALHPAIFFPLLAADDVDVRTRAAQICAQAYKRGDTQAGEQLLPLLADSATIIQQLVKQTLSSVDENRRMSLLLSSLRITASIKNLSHAEQVLLLLQEMPNARAVMPMLHTYWALQCFHTDMNDENPAHTAIRPPTSTYCQTLWTTLQQHRSFVNLEMTLQAVQNINQDPSERIASVVLLGVLGDAADARIVDALQQLQTATPTTPQGLSLLAAARQAAQDLQRSR